MSKTAALTRALPLLLAIFLDACGGGGGGAPPSYSVGGSITGLTTAGLVLANGADTVSPASGASNFTFAAPVVSGANYAVTVQAQPANATCTVSGGTGTMANAAVTSVQVSCSLNTFQIGGTISGLTTAGLTLANGSDTLSPAANATSFAFATRVTVGNSYSVSITQLPTGLNCTMANASGTATANVSNVAVNCVPVPVARWGNAATVGTGVYPLLASDPSGIAFFLGWETSGQVNTGMASRFTDAGGWTAPVAFTSAQAGTVLSGLQFDAQGKGFAIWSVPTGNIDGSVSPAFSRYTPGTGWGWGAMSFNPPLPPVLLPPNSTVYTSFPTLGLSVASDGTATALVQLNNRFTSTLPGSTILQFNLAALVASAAPGSDLLQIGPADPVFPASDLNPTTTNDSNGQPVSYFRDQTFWPFDPMTASTRPGCFAALFRSFHRDPVTLPDGSLGANTLTTTGLAMNTSVATGSAITLYVEDLLGENPLARGKNRVWVTKASTAIAASGDALTSWAVIADDFNSVTVYAQRFVNGGWLPRQQIYNNAGDYSISKILPVAALDAAGNGMIVFNSLTTLKVVTLTAATGAFSAATQLATDNPQPVSLQMDSRGNGFLLAIGSVRRFDATTGVWAAPTSGGGDANQTPVLALDTAGNAMVAWTFNGSILAMRYH